MARPPVDFARTMSVAAAAAILALADARYDAARSLFMASAWSDAVSDEYHAAWRAADLAHDALHDAVTREYLDGRAA